MKLSIKQSAAITLILSLIIISFGILSVFPWWSFVFPVILIGMFIHCMRWRIKYITIGFLSGFLVWFAANLYDDLTFQSFLLSRIALVLTVPKIIVLLLASALGGLVTALALHSGKLLLTKSL